MEPPVLSAKEQALIAAVRSNPELQDILADLVAEMNGATLTADAAEDAVVARVRQLGQTVLTRWAQARQSAVDAGQPVQRLVRHSKKNSAG
jgi:hypothetical protein